MAKRIMGVVAVLFALATIHAAAQFGPVSQGPSQSLVDTLATLRGLSDGSFQQVLWWAPNPSDPQLTIPDWNSAEHQIMQLGARDRSAVLGWLTGNGRQALYNRGATDRMIGPRTVSAGGGFSTPATPGPSAQYRIMPLAAPTLANGPPAGGVQVTGGFALVKKDATKAVVCVSFVNVAPATATAIRFAFPLVDASGNTVGTLDFTRTGTFSPNVAIDGPADANAYLGRGFGPRAAYDNCLVTSPATAALPLLQTRFVSYKIAGVRYADGAVWP
jgi:hypothetical protein